MYIDEINKIHAGQPLVKASELEKLQEWIGVLIDKSLEEQFPSLFSKEACQETILYPVPFKCGQNKPYYTINWMHEIDDTVLKSLDLFLGIYDERIILKHANTMQYVAYVKKASEPTPANP